MDLRIAETLIRELERHSGLIPIDKNLFLEMLVATDVQESLRFYEALPDTKQSLQETDNWHYFSLRRVLRNRNAEGFQVSGLKRVFSSAIFGFGVYSSDHLTRSLRKNRDLVEVMGKCGQPFSLLGKLQTFDYGGSEGGVYVMTRPVLIIPDVEDTNKVHAWEERNTRYEKEVGILRRLKRISYQEYLAHA